MNTFEPNEKAVIVNTGTPLLDGTVVTVCGITSTHMDNIFYIVGLPSPSHGKWTHITLTNACLKKV